MTRIASETYAQDRAARGIGAPLDLTAPRSPASTFPTFEKYAANPIFTPQMLGSDWPAVPIVRPSVIHVENLLSNPLGKFYMYFSTDHGTDPSGIGLAYADHPLGPWTYYGFVYEDTTTGANQTEWPSVMWSEEEQKVFLYHHVVNAPGASVGQVGCLATSSDGLTFTRYGIVIDPILCNGPTGNTDMCGSSSYLSVFRVAGTYYAYGITHTGNLHRYFLAASNDGKDWTIDPRMLGYNGSMSDAPASRHFGSNNNVMVRWGGQLWAVTLDTTWGSGVGANSNDFYAAPLSDDLRNLRGKPRKCVSSTLQSWESSFIKMGSVVSYQGKLYLFYRAGNPVAYGGAGEAFGVAVATPQEV